MIFSLTTVNRLITFLELITINKRVNKGGFNSVEDIYQKPSVKIINVLRSEDKEYLSNQVFIEYNGHIVHDGHVRWIYLL